MNEIDTSAKKEVASGLKAARLRGVRRRNAMAVAQAMAPGAARDLAIAAAEALPTARRISRVEIPDFNDSDLP